MNKAAILDIDFKQVATWTRQAERKFIENIKQVLVLQIQEATARLQAVEQQLQALAIKEAIWEEKNKVQTVMSRQQEETILSLLRQDLLSTSQIAEALNLSEQRVLQIHKRVLRKVFPAKVKSA